MELLIVAAAIVVLGGIWYVNRKTGLDVNQDGKVDLADAKAAVENTAAAVVQAADANNDGKVDAEDVKVVVEKAKTGAKKAATKAKTAVKKATSNRGRKPKQ